MPKAGKLKKRDHAYKAPESAMPNNIEAFKKIFARKKLLWYQVYPPSKMAGK
jgi:hypothetical protein